MDMVQTPATTNTQLFGNFSHTPIPKLHTVVILSDLWIRLVVFFQ